MDFTSRLKTLRAQLQTQKVAAALISSPANIVYLTGYANFSQIEREAYLLITPTQQYLFTDGRYTEQVAAQVPHFKLIELSPTQPLRPAIKQILTENQLDVVGVEADNLTLAEAIRFKKTFKIKPIDLFELRAIKDAAELSALQAACRLGDQLFAHTLTQIKLGITESELAWEMEKFTKDHGATFSFDPIVAFGPHGSMAHYATGHTKLAHNQPILLDFGVKLDGYCSDMTRVVFFGSAPDDFKKLYQTVIDAHQQSVAYLRQNLARLSKSGIPVAPADQAARDFILAAGYPEFSHALGHGIGLEVHEAPHVSNRAKNALRPGMVFSIEPGIYLAGEMGVRIEDLYLLHHDQLIQLTQADKNLICLK